MASNQSYPNGRYVKIGVQTGAVSGQAVWSGEIAGVALYDEDADGNAVVDRRGVYELTVKGQDTGGSNSAVSEGTKLYIDDGSSSLSAGDITPDSTNGVYLGKALGAVAGGGETKIDVIIEG